MRSALIPSMTVLICLMATTLAHPQTDDPGAAAEHPVTTDIDLVAAVQSLQKRVAQLEQRLAARTEQESLGRGLIAMQPIVANLHSENLTRYIRVSIILAVDGAQQQAAAQALQSTRPYIKDWLYSHLADKTVKDITGAENLVRLRFEILQGVNEQLRKAGHGEFVKAVMFDEINVQ